MYQTEKGKPKKKKQKKSKRKEPSKYAKLIISFDAIFHKVIISADDPRKE